jgi:hypothetical protein
MHFYLVFHTFHILLIYGRFILGFKNLFCFRLKIIDHMKLYSLKHFFKDLVPKADQIMFQPSFSEIFVLTLDPLEASKAYDYYQSTAFLLNSELNSSDRCY